MIYLKLLKTKDKKIHLLILVVLLILTLTSCFGESTHNFTLDETYSRSFEYKVVVGRGSNAENDDVIEDYTYVHKSNMDFFMKDDNYFIINDDDSITAIMRVKGSYYAIVLESFYDFKIPDIDLLESNISDKEYTLKGSFPYKFYLYDTEDYSVILESTDSYSLEYIYNDKSKAQLYQFISDININIPNYTELSYTSYILQDSPFTKADGVISTKLDDYDFVVDLDLDYVVIVGEDSYILDYSYEPFFILKNDTDNVSISDFITIVGEDNYYILVDLIWKDKYFLAIEESY